MDQMYKFVGGLFVAYLFIFSGLGDLEGALEPS